jgi:hypothetical protein
MGFIFKTLDTFESIREINCLVRDKIKNLIPEIETFSAGIDINCRGTDIRTSDITVYAQKTGVSIEEGGQIVKFSLTTIPNNKHFAISCNSFVGELYRKRGIATAMHDVKEFICQKAGITTMLATVNDLNAPELRVLEKRGWKENVAMRGQTFITMYKQLPLLNCSTETWAFE